MSRFTAAIRYFPRVFLAGLFTVLPLVATVAIVAWVVGFMDDFLGPRTMAGGMLARVGMKFTENDLLAYALGWVLVLVIICAVGLLAEWSVQRLLRDRVDAMFARLPVLGGVYRTVRQLVGMMEKKDQAELQGMRVVFCLFGGETGAAFLALMPTPELFRVGEIDYHAVLIPTAPVPFGGSLIFVPAASVLPANLSVDAFMSIYVSMGVTGPQFIPPSAPTATSQAARA